MEKYDVLNVVGEGSYGIVMKCRHRESGQYVAIKKFLETEDDPTVRKMAIREIKMLKKLRHDNLVNMLEVFRRKKRFFLVFEYLEHTILEELEARAGGLGFVISRKYIYQILRALDFIHSHNIIHRDIKPENVLVSRLGVIKLCDFGFARLYTENETFTDYVATRWYRSPELLVGDPRYGKEVDIWAIGCLYAEMMTGEPLFPGESDIDQLFQIIRVVGKLSPRHQILITRNPLFKGTKQEQNTNLLQLFPDWNKDCLDFLVQCLKMDGSLRPETRDLLKHDLFTRDDFLQNFLPELRAKINQETQANPLLKKINNQGSGIKITNEDKLRNKFDSSTKMAPKERISQIPIQFFNTHHRLSVGSEDQFRAFKTYLSNAQQKPQIKQISVNNLVFRENPSSNKMSVRNPSAKQKSNLDKLQTSSMSTNQLEPPSSPIQFQSLQPEFNLNLNQDNSPTIGHQKRLSPVNNLLITNQYFNNHRRNSNIVPPLQQIPQPKRDNKNYLQNSQIPLKNISIKTNRPTLLDVNILPLNSSSESGKEVSPKPFPLSYPWLAGNFKITAPMCMGKNLQKKNLTDLKNIVREPNEFFSTSNISPYKGNKKKLSPMSNLSFNDKQTENLSNTRRVSASSDQENKS